MDIDSLPFSLPSRVHPMAREFDNGFFEGLFPRLETGDVLTCPVDIADVFSEIAQTHSEIMLYSPRLDKDGVYNPGGDNLWLPCNYAYRNVVFDRKKFCFVGDCYHITFWDGTMRSGQRDSFLEFNPQLGLYVVPQLLDGVFKGAIVGQEYERNRGNYGVDFLIGDVRERSDLIQMPKPNSREDLGYVPLLFQVDSDVLFKHRRSRLGEEV